MGVARTVRGVGVTGGQKVGLPGHLRVRGYFDAVTCARAAVA